MGVQTRSRSVRCPSAARQRLNWGRAVRITDALLRLVDSGTPAVVYVTDGHYFEIGARQGLLAANNFINTSGFP
jgi:hypothetical protein